LSHAALQLQHYYSDTSMTLSDLEQSIDSRLALCLR